MDTLKSAAPSSTPDLIESSHHFDDELDNTDGADRAPRLQGGGRGSSSQSQNKPRKTEVITDSRKRYDIKNAK